MGARVTVVKDPGAGRPSELMDEAVSYIQRRPLIHFVVSEVQGGLAALSVYGFFLLFSFAAERLTELLPLKYTAAAHFLDMVLAWAAVFSGAFTFLVYTLANAVRLALHVWRQD